MNTRQKKFILEKLIPFMEREGGNGFAMEEWKDEYVKEDEYFDGVKHRAPKCGTVACIGGSIQILGRGRLATTLTGLDEDKLEGLFHDWEVGLEGDYGWPGGYRREFKKAKTARGKMRVAVRLLREVVKTEGACLRLVGSGEQM
jgi:hypothetical protein